MSLKTIFCPFNVDNCEIFGLDDLAGAAAFGGLFSAGSGLLGGLFSSGESRAQRKWATQENALNRQFQHDEAELAYQRNESTRIAQNKWNSEQAQVARMKEAGINPYNAIGGLSGSSVSSSGNTASAGNAAGSQMMYQQAKMDWVNNIAQAGLMAAQARKFDAETKNLNSNTTGQDLQNSYDDIRNSIQEQFGVKLAEADLKLKSVNFDSAKAEIGLKESITELNKYDLKNMRPHEKDLLVAKIATEKVMPAYFEALKNCNNVQAFCMGQKLGAEIMSLRASANRDNASASKSYSDIALNALLGEESVSRRFLNETLESESQSRIGLNTVDERIRNLEFQKEQRIYNETMDYFIQDLKSEYKKNILHNDRRDPDKVGAIQAGIWNFVDESRGFVNIGFSRSSSKSQFSGHTTSQSSFKGSTTSFSENHNFNHNTR